MKFNLALFFCLCLFAFDAKSQSLVKSYRALSHAEKKWVKKHPFIARKVFHLTLQARAVTDSLEKKEILHDANGGQLDAFRHAYWMALLSQHISEKKAMALGKAHEEGNYEDFKKGKTEDSLRADSMMCVMDLKNDSAGIAMGKEFKKSGQKQNSDLITLIIRNDRKGELFMIKKDAMGNYTDKSGRKIDMKIYNGKWFIPKVLVRSNYQQPPAEEYR